MGKKTLATFNIELATRNVEVWGTRCIMISEYLKPLSCLPGSQ